MKVRPTLRKARIIGVLAMLMVSATAVANEWVIGNVSIVEDYRAFDGRFGVLVTLTNKSYYPGGGATLSGCTERYRIVAGQANVTADLQSNFFATLLTARASGDRVRLFVDPSNNIESGYCAVQIVSLGDV